MSQNHLTDEQLQNYFDKLIKSDKSVALHLDSCEKCQIALADYKAVYSALEKDPGYELSASFADAVMAQLPEEQLEAERLQERKLDRIEQIAVIAIFCIMVGVGLYFLNIDSMFSSLKSLFSSANNNVSNSIKDIRSMLSGFGNMPVLVLFTVLTIGVISGIDSILIRMRKQTDLRTFIA